MMTTTTTNSENTKPNENPTTTDSWEELDSLPRTPADSSHTDDEAEPLPTTPPDSGNPFLEAGPPEPDPDPTFNPFRTMPGFADDTTKLKQQAAARRWALASLAVTERQREALSRALQQAASNDDVVAYFDPSNTGRVVRISDFKGLNAEDAKRLKAGLKSVRTQHWEAGARLQAVTPTVSPFDRQSANDLMKKYGIEPCPQTARLAVWRSAPIELVLDEQQFDLLNRFAAKAHSSGLWSSVTMPEQMPGYRSFDSANKAQFGTLPTFDPKLRIVPPDDYLLKTSPLLFRHDDDDIVAAELGAALGDVQHTIDENYLTTGRTTSYLGRLRIILDIMVKYALRRDRSRFDMESINTKSMKDLNMAKIPGQVLVEGFMGSWERLEKSGIAAVSLQPKSQAGPVWGSAVRKETSFFPDLAVADDLLRSCGALEPEQLVKRWYPLFTQYAKPKFEVVSKAKFNTERNKATRIIFVQNGAANLGASLAFNSVAVRSTNYLEDSRSRHLSHFTPLRSGLHDLIEAMRNEVARTKQPARVVYSDNLYLMYPPCATFPTGAFVSTDGVKMETSTTKEDVQFASRCILNCYDLPHQCWENYLLHLYPSVAAQSVIIVGNRQITHHQEQRVNILSSGTACTFQANTVSSTRQWNAVEQRVPPMDWFVNNGGEYSFHPKVIEAFADWGCSWTVESVVPLQDMRIPRGPIQKTDLLGFDAVIFETISSKPIAILSKPRLMNAVVFGKSLLFGDSVDTYVKSWVRVLKLSMLYCIGGWLHPIGALIQRANFHMMRDLESVKPELFDVALENLANALHLPENAFGVQHKDVLRLMLEKKEIPTLYHVCELGLSSEDADEFLLNHAGTNPEVLVRLAPADAIQRVLGVTVGTDTSTVATRSDRSGDALKDALEMFESEWGDWDFSEWEGADIEQQLGDVLKSNQYRYGPKQRWANLSKERKVTQAERASRVANVLKRTLKRGKLVYVTDKPDPIQDLAVAMGSVLKMSIIPLTHYLHDAGVSKYISAAASADQKTLQRSDMIKLIKTISQYADGSKPAPTRTILAQTFEQEEGMPPLPPTPASRKPTQKPRRKAKKHVWHDDAEVMEHKLSTAIGSKPETAAKPKQTKAEVDEAFRQRKRQAAAAKRKPG
jgi:hypothetical protein